MKNKLIILGLIGSFFLMVSCTVNKSLYLKGNAITWNKIKHQTIEEASNFSDNFIEQKLANNTNSNEKENFTPLFIGARKPISNKKSGSNSILENQIIKNKSVENFNVGDSVKIELFSGKVYFGSISKIEKEGYFIEIKNKREIFISYREIKQLTIIKKGQFEKPKISSNQNKGSIELIKQKNNRKNKVLKVLKTIGTVVLTILGFFTLLILILVIAFI